MSLAKLKKLLGPMPEKASLHPVVLESTDCGKYIREKVEYSVEDGDRVRAYILLPKTKRRSPAIFCYHQHGGDWDLGKSEVVGLAGDSDQAYAHELAESGYVTFAPDAIAFEERKKDVDGGTGQYFELATRLVQGKTLTAKVIHDVIVGMDYLCSRPEVNPKRIGFIGHSYGGRIALWMPAFDKRIKVSVSNCGCVNYKDSLERKTGIPMDSCVPAITQWGDLADIVSMGNKTHILVSATTDDKWSIGADELVAAVSANFQKKNIELAKYSGGHAFTQEMRQKAYTFFKNHL